jgi:hypothetical protein
LFHHGLISCQAMFSIELLLSLESWDGTLHICRMKSGRCLWTFTKARAVSDNRRWCGTSAPMKASVKL